MILDRFPGIKQLSKYERIILYCELLDFVPEENGLVLDPDPEILEEIDRRMEESHMDPDTAKSWSVLRARLHARLDTAQTIPL